MANVKCGEGKGVSREGISGEGMAVWPVHVVLGLMKGLGISRCERGR